MTSRSRKVSHNQKAVIMAADHSAGPSKEEMQLQLLNDKRTDAGTKGCATLVGQGLKIEESQ